MALLTAAALPEDRKVTGIVMLAAAVSPQFDVQPAAAKVETSIWNYYSWLDLFFLYFGTLLLGTIDGRHCIAAGAIGLHNPGAEAAMAKRQLVQIGWTWRMMSQFNFGEHFGCTHRVFVAEEIAPFIVSSEDKYQPAPD
jgi:hypothetical protein